jgi:hypothetical protein
MLQLTAPVSTVQAPAQYSVLATLVHTVPPPVQRMIAAVSPQVHVATV